MMLVTRKKDDAKSTKKSLSIEQKFPVGQMRVTVSDPTPLPSDKFPDDSEEKKEVFCFFVFVLFLFLFYFCFIFSLFYFILV